MADVQKGIDYLTRLKRDVFEDVFGALEAIKSAEDLKQQLAAGESAMKQRREERDALLAEIDRLQADNEKAEESLAATQSAAAESMRAAKGEAKEIVRQANAYADSILGSARVDAAAIVEEGKRKHDAAVADEDGRLKGALAALAAATADLAKVKADIAVAQDSLAKVRGEKERMLKAIAGA